MIGDLYASNAEFDVQLWKINNAVVLRKIKKHERVLFLRENYQGSIKSIVVITSDGIVGEILPGHFEEFRQVVL